MEDGGSADPQILRPTTPKPHTRFIDDHRLHIPWCCIYLSHAQHDVVLIVYLCLSTRICIWLFLFHTLWIPPGELCMRPVEAASVRSTFHVRFVRTRGLRLSVLSFWYEWIFICFLSSTRTLGRAIVSSTLFNFLPCLMCLCMPYVYGGYC